MSENILNKLTVKSVYGAIKTVIQKVTDPVTKEVFDIKVLEKDIHLMRIYGQATGFRIAASNYGDSSVFKGVFKAVRPDTGEAFTAGECCLPKTVESQLTTILQQVEGAEFAFDVWAVPAKNLYGYEYRIKSVIESKPAPVIAALEEKMVMIALENNSGTAKPDSKPATGKNK